jgi:glycosyltransferase involved in cell wall biosynthesis
VEADMTAPVRILHVVGAMNPGGTETWLMHVLRHIDRDRFHMDFLVHTTQACAYDDEVRALGSKIIPCPDPHRPLKYARQFKRCLRAYGPYDVVHSHVHHYSGYVLWLAWLGRVPIRIAHSHLDTSELEAKANPLRRFYLSLTRRMIASYATAGLAASKKAAIALFGPTWAADPRWRILYCGIDLSPFRALADPATVRAELGIPTNAFVIGHVGRFAEQKNHAFLVEVFAEFARQDSQAYLLMVGDGPLRPFIERAVSQAGLDSQVIFAGVRSDVPRLMLGAMDVFALPSLYEGLPIVGLEAQAAGLPTVLSDTITDEVEVVPRLVSRVSLFEGPSKWAERLLATRGIGMHSSEALAIIQQGPFNIEETVRILDILYVRELERARCAET